MRIILTSSTPPPSFSPWTRALKMSRETSLRPTSSTATPVNAANRWYDKMLTIVVTEAGQGGLVYEHSQMEGTPVAALAEHLFTRTRRSSSSEGQTGSSDGEGVARAVSATSDPGDVCAGTSQTQTGSQTCLSRRRRRLTSWPPVSAPRWPPFDDFGKNFPKSVDLSPDSFLQVAAESGPLAPRAVV